MRGAISNGRPYRDLIDSFSGFYMRYSFADRKAQHQENLRDTNRMLERWRTVDALSSLWINGRVRSMYAGMRI